jgi:uncharacterized protein (DUF849 family)
MSGEHPALALSPDDLAQDAQRVVTAGTQALHIHPRNAEGMQSLVSQGTAAALTAIRDCCPSLPCGASTARWIEPAGGRRFQHCAEQTRRKWMPSRFIGISGPVALVVILVGSGALG